MITGPAIRATRAMTGALLAGFVILRVASAAESQQSPAVPELDYDRDIRPIFEASCFRCHGPERPKSKFRLDNPATALKGGEVNTNDIVPFHSAESELIKYVTGADEEMRMPPTGKGEPLTPQQISTLKNWIDQGAQWSAGSAAVSPNSDLTITPVVGWIGVSGNQQKFQQDWSQKGGFVIGFEDFEMRQSIGPDTEFIATGRVMFDQSDYKVAMSLTRAEFGFVDGGYSTYRKYFNDTGGYYPPFGPPPYSAFGLPPAGNSDLYVDNQRAWFNVGLTVPHLPKITVGYEYQSRAGQESTLNWAQYSPDPNDLSITPKAILPAYRQTSATTQIIKLDINYDAGGFLLEDSFRGEFYSLNQAASTPSGYYLVDGFSSQSEHYTHFQAANAFRVEKQVQPWCFISGGYLYTHVDGSESFERVFGTLTSYPSIETTEQSQGIAVEQHSHTINANALLGPWEGFSVSAGVQADWQQRDGTSDLTGISFGSPFTNVQSASLEKSVVQGDFGVRYTRIPFTVVYAGAKFAREIYDLNETSAFFLPDTTSSTANLQDYQGGITVSPWPQVSLDVSYRYRDKRTTYNDGEANDPSIENGYPGFFRELDIASNDFEARLTLRPISWLKATLKYQLLKTEYHNNVSPSLVYFDPVLLLYQGGAMVSGDYEANVYSINLTLTPWRRLFLSTSFSYADSRMVSGINYYPAVAPYDGQIYSLTASANYVLNKSTDLNATYLFSKSNFQQDDLEGLPLGIVYDRNAVLVGVRRRFSKNITGSLQYAFSTYNEPSAAGVNNYTANAVFGSVKLLLP